MKKFKKSKNKFFNTLKILFLSYFVVFFLCTQDNSDLKNQNQYINDFSEVLKGIGFSEEEAKKASYAISFVYPIEMLKNNSYLLLPSKIYKDKTFAVNVNDRDAIILKKNKNDFSAFVSSTKIASEIVGNLNTSIDEKSGIVKIKNYSRKVNKNLEILNIIFKEGDNISSLTNSFFSNKKSLRKFTSSLSKGLNLSKIKVGSKAKIILRKKKLVAFYINITAKDAVVTYKSNNVFRTEKLKKSDVKNFLNKKIISENQNYKEFTRISLFNNPNYDVFKKILKKGQSIYELLDSYRVDSNEINKVLNKIKPHFNLRQIKAGQSIEIIFIDKEFIGISYEINKLSKLQAIKIGNTYRVYFYEKAYKTKNIYSKIVIESNLYMDSKKVNLPKKTFIELVRLLSFSLDFQRDIRAKTTFIILYENLYDYESNFITTGKIVYSKVLIDNNKNMEVFHFTSTQGKDRYYDKNGKSVRKTLMKTPIDGARLSSGFGTRRHPILGYNKMHKGLDFAAKRGTPIYAAGDGVIERANYFGGYGKYIRIKHNLEYHTAYAHLSKIAKGIRKNVRVNQGQIIGYVGTSGRSTGPHLHYEVLYNRKQINPYKLKMPEIEKLTDTKLQLFNIRKDEIKKMMNAIKN
ncbi:MAG: hypothetical protein CMP36_01805 [Rickettsiales bacterium]|nr:hypothetical protein [Rickettsiales bacterium]OUV81426.1 MAG: hypothetical protein CBC91_02305 [Rickettsiales bacterium TMED131]|tara:strand:+ start:569 stop:2464 length:1896 start_codon:yes stop_codon:yes gene_type:complete